MEDLQKWHTYCSHFHPFLLLRSGKSSHYPLKQPVVNGSFRYPVGLNQWLDTSCPRLQASGRIGSNSKQRCIQRATSFADRHGMTFNCQRDLQIPTLSGLVLMAHIMHKAAQKPSFWPKVLSSDTTMGTRWGWYCSILTYFSHIVHQLQN